MYKKILINQKDLTDKAGKPYFSSTTTSNTSCGICANNIIS